jgi:hypothetical protein
MNFPSLFHLEYLDESDCCHRMKSFRLCYDSFSFGRAGDSAEYGKYRAVESCNWRAVASGRAARIFVR